MAAPYVPTHISNSEAPSGWCNVVPQGDADPDYSAGIRTGTNLIKWSTLTSGINNSILESTFDSNIRAFRTALWLRDDHCVALAFHALDGPTDCATTRYPKFLVDAAIDPSLGPPIVKYPLCPENAPGLAVYQSLKAAVKYFATNNEPRARLYLWVEAENEPEPGDLIFPIFQYAINNDIASDEGEGTRGVLEDYSKHQPNLPNVPNTANTTHHRWCDHITTWKLKSCRAAGGAGRLPRVAERATTADAT